MICKVCRTGLVATLDRFGGFSCFKCPICGRCYDYDGNSKGVDD